MIVTKVDVKTVQMELPDHQPEWRELEHDFPMSSVYGPGCGPGRLDEMASAKERHYSVRTISDGRIRKHYLVNVKENEIFDHLFAIEKGDCEKKINEASKRAYQQGKESGFYEGLENGCKGTMAEVKSLSWWRRLFKAF